MLAQAEIEPKIFPGVYFALVKVAVPSAGRVVHCVPLDSAVLLLNYSHSSTCCSISLAIPTFPLSFSHASRHVCVA